MTYQQILRPTYVLLVLEGMKNAVFKQLFLGSAMFETPSLNHFLFENVLKSTELSIEVLRKRLHLTTQGCLSAFQNTQLPGFAEGEIIRYKAANGGREHSGTQDTMLKERTALT